MLPGHAQTGYAWLLPTSELPARSAADARAPPAAAALLVAGIGAGAAGGARADGAGGGTGGGGGMGGGMGSGIGGGMASGALDSTDGADAHDGVYRMLRFAIKGVTGAVVGADGWSDGIDLSSPQRRCLPLGTAAEHSMLVLVTVELNGFGTTVTIAPTHVLINELASPMHVRLFRDEVLLHAMTLPPDGDAHPLLLRGVVSSASHAGALVASTFELHLTTAAAAAAASQPSHSPMVLAVPVLLPRKVAAAAAAAGAAAARGSAGLGEPARCIPYAPPPPSPPPPPSALEQTQLLTSRGDALGSFGNIWYSIVRPGSTHTTRLTLSPPLRLVNTSSARKLHYSARLVRTGAVAGAGRTGLTGRTGGSEASRAPTTTPNPPATEGAHDDAAALLRRITSDHEGGTVAPEGSAALRLHPTHDAPLELRLRWRGFGACEPPVRLDARALASVSAGTPLVINVSAQSESGERIELHLIIKAAASAAASNKTATAAAAAPAAAAAAAAAAATTAAPPTGRAGVAAPGLSPANGLRPDCESDCELDCALELALIAPFEVLNETEATLALSASLDRALVLLLPPRRPAKGARAVLGSWGTDFIPHGLIHHVRVAAAAPVAEADERAEGDEGSSSLASLPPLLQPPKITSPEEGPLDWSPFLQLSKPACVTLGAEMGEALRVVIIPQERRVHGWVQRMLVIRPSICVHNRTPLPLRLAVCGFPYYHTLAAAPPTGARTSKAKRGTTSGGGGGGVGGDDDDDGGDNQTAELLRWQSSGALDEAGHPVTLTVVQICVEPHVLSIEQGKPRLLGEDEKDEGEEDGEYDWADGVSAGSSSAEPPTWIWSREIEVGLAKTGWRQRVALASECGQQRTLLILDVVLDEATGMRHVLVQLDPQPVILLHNLTSEPLFIKDAAAPHDALLRLAPGAQRPFCLAVAVEENLSRPISLESSAREIEGDRLLVSRTPSSAHAATLALSPPRVLTLVCHDTASDERRATDGVVIGGSGALVRTAICHQGPTCLVVFVPLHALDTACHAARRAASRAPPRDLSLSLQLQEVSILIWDTRRTHSELRPTTAPPSLRARPHHHHHHQQQQQHLLLRADRPFPVKNLEEPLLGQKLLLVLQYWQILETLDK